MGTKMAIAFANQIYVQSKQKSLAKAHSNLSFGTIYHRTTFSSFLDTSVYKGEKFVYESVLDIRTHYKLKHFSTYASRRVTQQELRNLRFHHKRLLMTNSSKTAFEEKSNTSNHILLREVTQKVLSKELSWK